MLGYCENLVTLELDRVKPPTLIITEKLIKNTMKKLAILKVNGVYVRLGSDWEGYR
jgi:hypothetical protein